jgi:hypothetical protein
MRRVEYLAVDEILPAERNPKLHAARDIDASITRFGFVEPIVMDERTGRLVAGHGRLEDLLTKQQGGGAPPDGIVVDEQGRWRVPVVRGWSSADDAEAAVRLVSDPAPSAAKTTRARSKVQAINELKTLSKDPAWTEFKGAVDLKDLNAEQQIAAFEAWRSEAKAS